MRWIVDGFGEGVNGDCTEDDDTGDSAGSPNTCETCRARIGSGDSGNSGIASGAAATGETDVRCTRGIRRIAVSTWSAVRSSTATLGRVDGSGGKIERCTNGVSASCAAGAAGGVSPRRRVAATGNADRVDASAARDGDANGATVCRCTGA